MNNYPSKNTMFFTIGILLIVYGIQFLLSINNNFLQTQYDWNHVTIKKNIGTIKVDSTSYNYLSINPLKKYTTDCKNSFRLTDINNNNYYFRAVYGIHNHDTIAFYGLEWLIEQPSTNGKYLLSEVEIPFTQKGIQSAVSIGDEYLCENEAKYFRINISGKSKIFFKGKNRDVFNYPHWAQKNYSLDSIINIIDKVEYADYYILFFDGQTRDEITQSKLQIIKEKLMTKKPKKVFWITLPDNAERHRQINAEIEKMSDSIFIIIDINKLLEKTDDKFLSDHKSLSKTSYIKISNEIAKQLND